MKSITLALCFVVGLAFAQTNAIRIYTTNYVADASHIRVVDGQLYNIQLSKKWESIRCKYQNQTGDFAVFQKIDRVKIGERKQTQSENENSTGGFSSYAATIIPPADRNIYADEDGAIILLKNFPAGNFVTGQELSPRLLRVSQTNYNGGIVAIYDCGKPHMVPVVTSKTIKTDSISGAK